MLSWFDLLQLERIKAMNFNDVAIVSVKEKYHRTHFRYMSKDDAINIMNNCNLNEKRRFHRFFLIKHKKWVEKVIITEIEKWYYIEQKIIKKTIKKD